jgi:ATP-dependent RNA helicase DeaD
MENIQNFTELGLSENLLAAVKEKGFEEPTPIQAKIIPLLLSQTEDIVGRAQTGTGKTAAFALPLIQKLQQAQEVSGGLSGVKVLVLVPTRELAVQVSAEIYSLRGGFALSVLPVYGGQSMSHQLTRLKKGVHIVVGTPGRIIDHINRKSLKLEAVTDVVLDEADEMLNMGFIDDVEEILKSTPQERRTMLFSATMPYRIADLAKKHMKNHVSVSVESGALVTDLTEQIYFEVEEGDKLEALCRIIDMENEFYGLIFCHTKIDTDRIATKLADRGYEVAAMHGDIAQNDREKILARFRNKSVPILVATDVAARGIDIEDLTHVINFSLPRNPESYIHRIGRTGRAGKHGTAVTFITPEEYRKLMFIKRAAKTEIQKRKVPGISQVISTRRSKIKKEIIDSLVENTGDKFESLAEELLETSAPLDLVAALLRYSFHGELDEKRYSEMREVGDRAQGPRGKARLFVGLGKADKMTPRKLAAFIQQQTSVRENNIDDIQVFDAFSFITVPFKDAEVILGILGKGIKGEKPIVKQATERGSGGGAKEKKNFKWKKKRY